MKIAGITLGPNVEEVIIPRGDGNHIKFICRAVLDSGDFEKLCPIPVAPMITRRGETQATPDLDDEKYKKAVIERGKKEFKWMIIQSLLATPGLEFEFVNPNDPTTWDNLDKEFSQAGFSAQEVGAIYEGCLAANCMSEKKLKEARESFTRSQAQEAQ